MDRQHINTSTNLKRPLPRARARARALVVARVIPPQWPGGDRNHLPSVLSKKIKLVVEVCEVPETINKYQLKSEPRSLLRWHCPARCRTQTQLLSGRGVIKYHLPSVLSKKIGFILDSWVVGQTTNKDQFKCEHSPPSVLVVSCVTPRPQLLSGRVRTNKSHPSCLKEKSPFFTQGSLYLMYLLVSRAGKTSDGGSVPLSLYRKVQLDCFSCGRTQIINLPENQKGYETFETTFGKLSARRIRFCPVHFCVGIILKVTLNNFQNNA